MNVALVILGVLALGALLISAAVFANAARRFVSGESQRDQYEALTSDFSPYGRRWTQRARRDRRQRPEPASFPIILNGIRIEFDRRVNADRRRMA